MTPPGDEVVLTGVATDCGVLATALGAIDTGRRVTVVSDACAGQSNQAHEATLELIDLLRPLARLVTRAEVLAEWELLT